MFNGFPLLNSPITLSIPSFVFFIPFLINSSLFLILCDAKYPKPIIDNNVSPPSVRIFKSSDFFNINIYKKTFNTISNYLVNKYKINNEESSNKISYFKKIIKLKSTGLFDKDYHLNWLKTKLDDEFILKYDDQNPDYLIYNVFHPDDLNPNYTNAIRIAIYTENIMPDINYADYVMSQYHINYLDRYFKYNIFLWQNFSEINQRRFKVINNPIRKKFCAAVISNCGSKFRMDFINKLSLYKTVDIEGKCKNSDKNRTIKNKIDFLSDYKFSIAMENSNGDGYLSEKIVDSFIAGTIPIYYGDYLLDEFINPKTYILIKGENDIDTKIEYIKKIDKDDKLYMSIMKEKPIIDNKFIDKIDKKEIKLFLQHIFRQEKNKAFRRDNNYYDYNCQQN